METIQSLTQIHEVTMHLLALGPYWIALGFAATLALGGLRILGR